LKCNALSWIDPAGAEEATRLAEKAIELDPGYAHAHALLAMLSYSPWDDGPRSSPAALERAYMLAVRAVELDDGESTCHAMLGAVCLHRRQFDLAVQFSRRAVELNPNNQWNAADLGPILALTGESEEALTWFARAREIDPYFDQPWAWRAAGIACMNLHRYAEALSMLGRARVRAYPYVALIAGCHARLGNRNAMEASVAECLSMKRDFSIVGFVKRWPFKNPADAEQLAASLHLAGLPG
jgi:tetratricopeptide (TPR) repeat protein